jgi:hypothetical protein
MKKYFFIIGSISSLLWYGCKEKVPAGVVLNTESIAKDTSYITTTIPVSQVKNVLLEEFTGVKCANCPQANEKIKQLQLQHKPRLLVVKIHSNLLAQPVKTTDPDFRCDDANSLKNGFGEVSKPSAGIDRVLNAENKLFHQVPLITGPLDVQQAKTTPINIVLANSLNATKDSITITAEMTFTTASTNKYMYHLYVLENDVEATQDSFDVVSFKTIEIEGYKHEEIFRKSITPVFIGSPLPDSTQVPGRVYRKIIQFAKPSNVISINNAEVVFFITDAVTKEIIHSQHIKM